MQINIERPDQIEVITANLIAKIKRSQYAKQCFEDARYFVKNDGYCYDVALAIAWNYWK